MNADQFNALCLPATATLHQALEALNATGRGILLVTRADGSLQRTLTDGDLRRAALSHVPEDSAVSALPEQAPVTVGLDAGLPTAMAVLDKHQIDHLPVVDEAGRAVDIMFRRELSQRIWLSSPHLGEEETAFVEDAFKTNWIAPLGPHVDGFERELASYAGVGHGAAVSSGTAAIHLALLLLGVKPGDTVFCSSLTFVGSCNPILYCNARPVFIDSQPQTWNMCPQALERAFEWAQREGRMPRCVIVVNLYGQSADMDALLAVCERYGVPLLEDAAESLGAKYKGRASGSFGAIGIFSFNGNKIITTSGGGMLVTNDAQMAERARKLATQAREPAAHYEHIEVGFNYRMSNVLAGIGRGQLRVLDQRVEQRRQVFDIYRAELADAAIEWMPEPEGYRSTRWLSCFTLPGTDGQSRRDRLLRALERHSIEARPVWKPMHMQPLFKDAPYFAHEGGDFSKACFESGVCLPSGSNLTQEQQGRVIDQLRRALQQAGARATV
ncbi:aminotransferase class I/II-fold pyridoxal phosphate-dependent enzyme [Caenimonas sp. SL110]|uniref:aminotransferase class I/II-fold pyridoxal phosphate-dependent enzyme n=1 Tax=Caenimonas sp. SL110 TaxID=1450524 RepID=UPI00065474B7|nr:aminotransferase class I/II-fold pyridoxal phosphate-dependent enzyme [Caenimonas sp. SL110]